MKIQSWNELPWETDEIERTRATNPRTYTTNVRLHSYAYFSLVDG